MIKQEFYDKIRSSHVNAQIKDETELGKLMHDMWCVEAEDMHYGILAERVRYFKENEEGVATMCRAMEEMRNDTVFTTTLALIKNVMLSGYTAEDAMKLLRIPADDHAKYMPDLMPAQ